MPDLIKLTTTHWKLNVWSNEVDRARTQRALMLSKRGLSESKLKLELDTHEAPAYDLDIDQTGHFIHPCFFENKAYEFEFELDKEIKDAQIIHKLTSICESFRFTGSALRGTINFGNDIGWFKLEIAYSINQKEFCDKLSFEVLPLKMSLKDDLDAIQNTIDKEFPLWRFAIQQKTEQNFSRSSIPYERFPLLWLAQFKSLRAQLEHEVNIVCNAPHNRLQSFSQISPLNKIKGKINSQLAERIATAIADKRWEQSFVVTRKKLSINTPENRFVKMVLKTSCDTIASVVSRLLRANKAPDQQIISKTFIDELNGWIKSLDSLLASPMFSEVGPFEGHEKASLVLHHRPGYAGVYRIWTQLQAYLKVFGNDAAISLRSISELYEAWCFLELRQILIALGFEETQSRAPQLQKTKAALTVELKDGMGPAFTYIHANGLKIKLAHEPIFRKPTNTTPNIYSWVVTQKPDIVLEATYPSGERLLWIFDAKYRIAESVEGPDLAPDDAINQMHRYKDALIHRSQQQQITRPVLGAFALYPGWYPDQSTSRNPYQDAIDAVGVGAFALLPGQSNEWLKSFLQDNLTNSANTVNQQHLADYVLAKPAARIPPEGLVLQRP